jgi:hypothetical protein
MDGTALLSVRSIDAMRRNGRALKLFMHGKANLASSHKLSPHGASSRPPFFLTRATAPHITGYHPPPGGRGGPPPHFAGRGPYHPPQPGFYPPPARFPGPPGGGPPIHPPPHYGHGMLGAPGMPPYQGGGTAAAGAPATHARYDNDGEGRIRESYADVGLLASHCVALRVGKCGARPRRAAVVWAQTMGRQAAVWTVLRLFHPTRTQRAFASPSLKNNTQTPVARLMTARPPPNARVSTQLI